MTRTQNKKFKTLQAFVTITRNRSLKFHGTSPAPPRWQEIITIIERATISPKGAETTIKVPIETIPVATQASKAKQF